MKEQETTPYYHYEADIQYTGKRGAHITVTRRSRQDGSMPWMPGIRQSTYAETFLRDIRKVAPVKARKMIAKWKAEDDWRANPENIQSIWL